MKKIIVLIISLISLFIVAGCSTNKEKDLENKIKDLEQQIANLENEKENLKNNSNDLENELNEKNQEIDDLENQLDLLKNGKFSIKYTDFLGNTLEYTYKIAAYDSVLDALCTNFDIEKETSTYGTYLKRINNSFIDNNWSIMIYENNVAANTGIDGLEINSGDVFEFKHECWNTTESGYGTFDNYDVLVDKYIYKYAVDYLPEIIKADTTYNTSNYWNYMLINLMKENNYDINYFNCNTATDELINTVKNTDVTSLSGTNIGKYYYYAKALNQDLTNFKNQYSSFDFGTKFNEYQTPFMIGCAKYLECEGVVADIINTQTTPSTTWGYDGYCWQYSSIAIYNTLDDSIINSILVEDFGNGTSNALPLMVYAASNKNAREYKSNDLDFIKILVDNYYNESLGIISWSKTDTKLQVSTSQIYASLCAYKVQRDLGKAAYIFA